MKSDFLSDVISKINDRHLSESIHYRKKKPPLFKAVSIGAACFAVLASLWIFNPLANKTPLPPQESNSEYATDNNNISLSPGIYIPKIDLPDNGSGIVADMLGLIVYNGRIYTQAEYMACDETVKNAFIGDYLGHAGGKIDEWSSKGAFSEEFASSVTGDVYSVKGYDKSFRICIPEMYEGCAFLAFFENLNDISLSTGADLYGKRLSLKGNYDDLFYLEENTLRASSLTNEDISRFVDLLYDSPFEEADYDTLTDYRQIFLYFKMKDKTTVSVRLYENGYAVYDNGYGSARYFVHIQDKLLDKIFDTEYSN